MRKSKKGKTVQLNLKKIRRATRKKRKRIKNTYRTATMSNRKTRREIWKLKEGKRAVQVQGHREME